MRRSLLSARWSLSQCGNSNRGFIERMPEPIFCTLFSRAAADGGSKAAAGNKRRGTHGSDAIEFGEEIASLGTARADDRRRRPG